MLRPRKDRAARRAGIALMFAAVVVCSMQPRVVSAQAFHPTGLREPTPEEKAWWEKNAIKITGPTRLAAPPAAYKNTRYLPKVGSQIQGSCAAWAVSYYYKTYQEAREHGWVNPNPAVNPERVMSPAYIYSLNCGGVDNGSSMQGNAKSIVEFGNATWKDATEATLPCYKWPTEDMFRNAIPYRGLSVAEIDLSTVSGLAALKEHLASGDPAVTQVAGTFTNFDGYPNDPRGVSNTVYFAHAGSNRDARGHALMIIGYDDNKRYFDGATTKSGALLLVNSWGTNWGVVEPSVGTRGFMWISYEYFRTYRVAGIDPIHAVMMTDRIGHQPKMYGVVAADHVYRAELKLQILGGDKGVPGVTNDPDWAVNAFPSIGMVPIRGDQRVVVDLTDGLTSAPDTHSFWLSAFDARVDFPFRTSDTGTITYFAIERVGKPRVECQDVPLQTAEMEYRYLNIGVLQPDRTVTFESFTGVNSNSAWGDYDNDGDLDVAVCSLNTIKLYRNDNGVFRDARLSIPSLQSGRAAWGDFNDDGRLDLALCGIKADRTYITQVYRNRGGGELVETGIALPGVAMG
ncbi:VCBS repeat-containing protein, partial [Candidatus Sumerlaeota bacterium]|nr:VCBS repeat-containing protein [Candidatus Sumerlaeota bacterium]